MSYSFINKESLEGNCENTHIFISNNSGSSTTANNPSVCGLVNRIAGWNGKTVNTESEARTHAANQQNTRAEICGRCVATLYSDKK